MAGSLALIEFGKRNGISYINPIKNLCFIYFSGLFRPKTLGSTRSEISDAVIQKRYLIR